jgi:hypothetical protein
VRRLLFPDLLNPVFPLLFFLIFIQGCSRPMLQTYPVADKESEMVLAAFSRFQQKNAALCNCCLDAEADISISVSGWFHDQTGKLSGYLQAMEPGYIRFVALNPLGQPWYILVTDGETFRSLNVLAEKAYEGSIHSKTYNKFSPAGFTPGSSYYWLTGTLQPEDTHIRAVRSDGKQDGYWLQIRHVKEGTESMVLFDPVKLRILRHVLHNERGEYLAEAAYEDYQQVTGTVPKDGQQNLPADVLTTDDSEDYCPIPGRITILSYKGSEKIDLKLHSFIAEAHFLPTDFTLEIPGNYDQLFVR